MNKYLKQLRDGKDAKEVILNMNSYIKDLELQLNMRANEYQKIVIDYEKEIDELKRQLKDK